MILYLEIVVFCLINEASLQAAFHLTRGLKDKFTNPQCHDNSHCSTDQCATYFARCETESCKVCVCDELLPTYVASEKRCVKDDEIVPDTGMLWVNKRYACIYTSCCPYGDVMWWLLCLSSTCRARDVHMNNVMSPLPHSDLALAMSECGMFTLGFCLAKSNL